MCCLAFLYNFCIIPIHGCRNNACNLKKSKQFNLRKVMSTNTQLSRPTIATRQQQQLYIYSYRCKLNCVGNCYKAFKYYTRYTLNVILVAIHINTNLCYAINSVLYVCSYEYIIIRKIYITYQNVAYANVKHTYMLNFH